MIFKNKGRIKSVQTIPRGSTTEDELQLEVH